MANNYETQRTNRRLIDRIRSIVKDSVDVRFLSSMEGGDPLDYLPSLKDFLIKEIRKETKESDYKDYRT